MELTAKANDRASDFIRWIDRTTRLEVQNPCRAATPPRQKWFAMGEHLPSFDSPGIYALDLETFCVDKAVNKWVVFCAVLYDFGHQTYYYWLADRTTPLLQLPVAPGSVLIGHNITAYDRRYLEAEYSASTPYLYLDTQSMAIRLRGISNQQLPLWKKQHKEGNPDDWAKEHYGNSLAALYEGYFGEPLDKGLREKMLYETWYWYQSRALDILDYCASDVKATANLFKEMWPEVKEAVHPISIYASALLSQQKLPINKEAYEGYLDRVDSYVKAEKSEILACLDRVRQETFETVVEPWMRGDLAVSQMPLGFAELNWTKGLSGPTKGQPLWWRKLPKALTLDQRLTPVLLGIQYEGKDVRWPAELSPSQWFAGDSPIPHPKGEERLGGFFNKHFWPLFDSGVITLRNPEYLEILRKIANLQLWKAFQGRIHESNNHIHRGWHIPAYLAWGTVSGRGADPVWLVAPKTDSSVPGSELRSLVRAQDGYRLVGADFSSQEMRIFALLGDASAGHFGASDLSRLVYSGDVHTALSEESGAPREVCKNINYGAVYGLGLQTAEVYCRLAGMTDPRAMAPKILDRLKGRKANGHYVGGLGSLSFNAVQRLIATPRRTKTPILFNRLSKALWTKDFVPSRQNWIIQAAGQDLRDLLVCFMAILIEENDLDAKLAIYVHDEPRYLVALDDALPFANLLQFAHRAIMKYVCEVLELDPADLPPNLEQFDSVEIDRVWRKDAHADCLTPTQSVPIPAEIALKPE